MPQQNKDLQYFKDEVARENGYRSFEDFDDRSTFEYDHNTPTIIDVIANRYATYREQQAKDAAFKEGAAAQRNDMRNTYATMFNSYKESIPDYIMNHSLAESPYREKGGEDDQ